MKDNLLIGQMIKAANTPKVTQPFNMGSSYLPQGATRDRDIELKYNNILNMKGVDRSLAEKWRADQYGKQVYLANQQKQQQPKPTATSAKPAQAQPAQAQPAQAQAPVNKAQAIGNRTAATPAPAPAEPSSYSGTSAGSSYEGTNTGKGSFEGYVDENTTTVGEVTPDKGTGSPFGKNKFFYDSASKQWKPMNEFSGEVELDQYGKPVYGKNAPAMATRSDSGQFMLDPRATGKYKMTYQGGQYHAKPLLSEEDIKMRQMLKLPGGTALGSSERVVGFKDGKAITSSGATYDLRSSPAQQTKPTPMSMQSLQNKLRDYKIQQARAELNKTKDPYYKEYMEQKRLMDNYGAGGWYDSTGRALSNFGAHLGGWSATPTLQQGESFEDFSKRLRERDLQDATLQDLSGGRDWTYSVNPVSWIQRLLYKGLR